MAVLHLMVGLPCSGKTTYAKRLEQECHALRFTPHEWHLRLFGDDLREKEIHEERHTAVERIMWEVAERALCLGVDVILDFGLWAKSERQEFRKRAEQLGASVKLHYMDVSLGELEERLAARNQQAGEKSVFHISVTDLRLWASVFEQPGEEELDSSGQQ